VHAGAIVTTGTRPPALDTEREHHCIKRGPRECSYLGAARKPIDDKWSPLSLLILRDECMRFNALLRGVEGISPKALVVTPKEPEKMVTSGEQL
jgi:DNA-binding HxlR family transcriptional regulator